MKKKEKLHPDLIFAEKASGLYITLFHTLLKNQDHYLKTKLSDYANFNAGYIRGQSHAFMDILTKLTGYLNSINALAPDEMQTALQIINDLNEYAKEHFTLSDEQRELLTA